MRELKFRSWKMHYGKLRRCVFSPFGLVEYAQRHPEAPVLHNEDVNDIRDFMPNADVIEQYTGLKDKNGKEIYEGDIVRTKSPDRDNFNAGAIEMVQQMYLVMNSAHYRDPEISNCEPLGYYCDTELEVIGNIHENPELLKKEK